MSISNQGHTIKAQEKNGNSSQKGDEMKILSLSMMICACVLSGCDNAETKSAQHLASLTCEASREDRTKEELQAIGDACFRGGSYSKSSGKTW
jgi:hypothetical protein